jgi:hypothetical protein
MNWSTASSPPPEYPPRLASEFRAPLGEPTYFANTVAPAGFFALMSLFLSELRFERRARKAWSFLEQTVAIDIDLYPLLS